MTVTVDAGDGRFIDVEADGFGVHLAGYFNGNIYLPDSTSIFSTGGSDILYAEYSSEGEYQDYLIFGGASNEQILPGSTLMNSFRLTFGGTYYNTIDFGPGQDTLSGPTAQGNEDMFLVQYIEVLTPSVSEYSKNRITIYPNPAQEFVRVQTEKPWGSYTIIDVWGREVAFNNWNSSNRIDVSELPSGIYFLRIENTDNAISLGRFSKW